VTLQNRVAPTGEIVAVPARGTIMGNRGCIHRPDRTLGAARWRSKAWIACRLEFKGRHREPMPPGRWTALFFLDEATALAAGHRPCAECRRDDFNAFAEAWRESRGLRHRPRAHEMDAVLHAERIDSRTRRQRTTRVRVGDLPEGAMVRVHGVVGLLLDGSVLPWSFDGYASPKGVDRAAETEVLTPASTVAAIAAGYRPGLHPTAEAERRRTRVS